MRVKRFMRQVKGRLPNLALYLILYWCYWHLAIQLGWIETRARFLTWDNTLAAILCTLLAFASQEFLVGFVKRIAYGYRHRAGKSS